MLIEHQGKQPRVHPTAYIAPSVVISGDVEICAETRVLHGVVITAEGAPVSIGSQCVVMEQAVVRGAGGRSRRFPTVLGDYVLVGPHAYLVGCTVEDRCFIATAALVFNGAHIKRGCTVTLQGVVHIGTTLEEGEHVPLQHVAIGTPATTCRPGDPEAVMAALQRQGFARTIFDIDLAGKSEAKVKEEYASKYARALAGHRADRMLVMCTTAGARVTRSGRRMMCAECPPAAIRGEPHRPSAVTLIHFTQLPLTWPHGKAHWTSHPPSHGPSDRRNRARRRAGESDLASRSVR